jgi:hypothetical protein
MQKMRMEQLRSQWIKCTWEDVGYLGTNALYHMQGQALGKLHGGETKGRFGPSMGFQ